MKRLCWRVERRLQIAAGGTLTVSIRLEMTELDRLAVVMHRMYCTVYGCVKGRLMTCARVRPWHWLGRRTMVAFYFFSEGARGDLSRLGQECEIRKENRDGP